MDSNCECEGEGEGEEKRRRMACGPQRLLRAFVVSPSPLALTLVLARFRLVRHRCDRRNSVSAQSPAGRDPMTDHGRQLLDSRARALPPTMPRQEAERACEDLLLQIREAADRCLDAAAGEIAAREAVLTSLIGRYAACARAADSPPELMLQPLRGSLGRFFYDRTTQSDALVRHALLTYFDVTE